MDDQDISQANEANQSLQLASYDALEMLADDYRKRHGCLDAEVLSALCDGQLRLIRLYQAKSHLKRCALCLDDYTTLMEIFAAEGLIAVNTERNPGAFVSSRNYRIGLTVTPAGNQRGREEDKLLARIREIAPPDTRSIVIARLSGLEWDEISQILGLRQRILLDRWERLMEAYASVIVQLMEDARKIIHVPLMGI